MVTEVRPQLRVRCGVALAVVAVVPRPRVAGRSRENAESAFESPSDVDVAEAAIGAAPRFNTRVKAPVRLATSMDVPVTHARDVVVVSEGNPHDRSEAEGAYCREQQEGCCRTSGGATKANGCHEPYESLRSGL